MLITVQEWKTSIISNIDTFSIKRGFHVITISTVYLKKKIGITALKLN